MLTGYGTSNGDYSSLRIKDTVETDGLRFDANSSDGSGNSIILIVTGGDSEAIFSGTCGLDGNVASLVVDPALFVPCQQTEGGSWFGSCSSISSNAEGQFFQLTEFSIATPQIANDIQAGKRTDCRGSVSVAIYGSETLDVTQIDQSTLLFEELDVLEKRNGALACEYDHIDSDEYTDLICRYENATTEGSLTGELIDGTPIEGSDTFCVL